MTPDRPIEAGDLAMVVHRCCDEALPYGFVFTVAAVSRLPFSSCRFCDHEVVNVGLAFFGLAQCRSYPTAWLRRIPPLSEPESTTTHTPAEVPA